MTNFVHDIRFGLRMLAKRPAVTLVAVLALGLGIGANSATFTVINALFLRPLPYKDPDRLAIVWERNFPRNRTRNVVSPGNYLDWKAQNDAFGKMAALSQIRANLTGAGEPEELQAVIASVEFFPTLGVAPLHGRVFNAEEDKPGGPRVVVISHRLWQRRFGSDPGLVGKAITLNGAPYTVLGIMPPRFHFMSREIDVWSPMRLDPAHDYRKTSGRYMFVVARLKPGASWLQAQAQMDAIGRRLEQAYPEFDAGWGVNVVPLQEQLVGDLRRALQVLAGAVGFVLLIACANVANLLLARAASRQREMAIRASLGAGRWRVARQLLTESVLLGLLGGVGGALLAQWGVSVLLALAPKDLPLLEAVVIDWRVFIFTVVIALLTGILFGLAPAFAAARTNLSDTLKEGSRATSAAGGRLRQAFVVGQLALTLVLLAWAGLLIRIFSRLQAVDPGLQPKNLLTMRVLLPGSKYREGTPRTAFFTEAIRHIRALPGVRAASAVSFLPFSGPAAGTGFLIAGRPAPRPGEKAVTVVRTVLPGFFQTTGIPLLRGRDFTAPDNTAGAPHRFVVNQAFVKQYFPNEEALGKSISVEMARENPYGEIIGVVGDLREGTLDAEPRPTAYYVHTGLPYSFMTFVVRTASDPLALAGPVSAAIRSLDAEQPVAEIRSMEQVLATTLARQRFNTTLLGAFAALALVLAAVGIYGVVSYAVAERTHEIGVRMALGARAANVLGMVLLHGLRLTAMGVLVGLVASLAVTRVMETLLFRVKATDPVTFAGVAAVLLGVALAAVLVPARRATRVDPLVALRYE